MTHHLNTNFHSEKLDQAPLIDKLPYTREHGEDGIFCIQMTAEDTPQLQFVRKSVLE